jgi:biopolymer transport protein ExbD
MNLRKNKGEEAEVAAEAMNDIMFFLMLFFLIISTMVNPNVIKLAVPNNATEKRALNKKTPLVLEVVQNGAAILFLVDGSDVKKENLEARLAMEMKGIDDPIVVIRADDELSIQGLVDVLSLGEKMNIKMVFSSPKKD